MALQLNFRGSSLTFAALMVAACDAERTPSSGSADPSQSTAPRVIAEGEEWSSDGHRALPLVAIDGHGRGWLRARRIPHPTTPGNFAVHIVASIRHAIPNAAYVVQRAPEIFAPPGAPAGFDVSTTLDGSCQRALGLPPWSTLSPPPAAFLTFPDQGNGAPVITTDADGSGSADFVFALAFPLPTFDVAFRVLENSPAPTSAFQSPCKTLSE
jgi:hypothetical protein